MFHYSINIIIINIINNLKLIKVKLNFELSIMLILLIQLQLSDKALANDIILMQKRERRGVGLTEIKTSDP